MLSQADAALVIGDPALLIDPDSVELHVLGLGTEWEALTGLPMVFAVWAGREGAISPRIASDLLRSYELGEQNLDTIVKIKAGQHGISETLAKDYLEHRIVYRLGDAELEGMRQFLDFARADGHLPREEAVQRSLLA
jgi:predicted solute-binding protein